MTCRTVLASLLIFAAGLSGAAPAVAQPLDEITAKLEIAVQLEQQGYKIIEIDRTWLGRIRIAAENDRYRREIVFDRVTGEIRRDLVEDKTGGATALPNFADIVGRGGNVVSTRNQPAPPGAAGGGKGRAAAGIGNDQGGGGDRQRPERGQRRRPRRQRPGRRRHGGGDRGRRREGQLARGRRRRNPGRGSRQRGRRQGRRGPKDRLSDAAAPACDDRAGACRGGSDPLHALLRLGHRRRHDRPPPRAR